jgi:hypothetical protein
MEPYKALHRFDRSEAPLSVALAMVLAEPAYGHRLLSGLAGRLGWKMRRWSEAAQAEALDLGPGDLQATALFHPYRDLILAHGRAAADAEAADPWRGEIDVVAVVPERVVVGIEVKVLSTTSKLAQQIEGQVAGLRLLADEYECPHLSQVAIAPTFPDGFPDHVNRLPFAELAWAVVALHDAHAPMSELLTAALRQLNLVRHLTQPTKQPTAAVKLSTEKAQSVWKLVTLDELRALGKEQAHASEFVGVLEGLAAFDVNSRPRWKVAPSKLGRNWYPLPDVAQRIEQLLPGLG